MLSRRCALLGVLGAFMATASDGATELAAAQGGPIALSPGSTDIALQQTGGANLADALSQVDEHSLTLVLRGLAAKRPPGTGYFVFFNVSAGATPDPADVGLAGTISFFGAPETAAGSSRNVSFEVSDVLARLRLAGRLSDTLILTIVPTGKPAPDSRPTINHIALFES
jgi:hypothetical protein